MQRLERITQEVAILVRLVTAEDFRLSRAAAEGVLALNFSPTDKERMHALTTVARSGVLTPAEQAEAIAYSRLASHLGILKSRARLALKRRDLDCNTGPS